VGKKTGKEAKEKVKESRGKEEAEKSYGNLDF